MYIKPQTVIPASVKVSKIAPGVGRARSIYSLERQEERSLERAEQTKRAAQKFLDMVRDGMKPEHALTRLDIK